jgi:hypothetical protein
LLRLLVQGLLLLQHRLDVLAVRGHLGELGLLLIERLAVLLSRPLRTLASVGGLGGEVGVVLRERAHELEPVGELGEVLGAQQDVELVAGSGVGLDGAGLEILGGGCGFGLGLLLVGEGGVEFVLDAAEADFASLYCSITTSSFSLTSCSFALAASTSAFDGAAEEEVTGSRGRSVGTTKTTATVSRAVAWWSRSCPSVGSSD